MNYIGIAFVAQPSFIFGTSSEISKNRDIGILIGISSAICAGIQYVIVNYTKKDCHWLQVEQITSALSTFILCPLGAISFALYYYSTENKFIIQWDNLNVYRWFEEIALGLLGFTALALLTRGSQLDAPARTAICLYLEIPFTYAGQCIMTKRIPNLYIFIGIFLVLCSVIIPAIRKLRKANKLKKLKLLNKNKNKNIKISRKNKKYHRNSTSSDIDDDENQERIPLINDNDIINVENDHTYGGINGGVTVDWSSAETSSYNSSDNQHDALL